MAASLRLTAPMSKPMLMLILLIDSCQLLGIGTRHPIPGTDSIALKHAKIDCKEEGGQFGFRAGTGGQKFDNLAD